MRRVHAVILLSFANITASLAFTALPIQRHHAKKLTPSSVKRPVPVVAKPTTTCRLNAARTRTDNKVTTTTTTTTTTSATTSRNHSNRRHILQNTAVHLTILSRALLSNGGVAIGASPQAYPTIDVNNAMAREFTAFPGLYPTIATKIVNAAKNKPFQSKKDVYAALDTDMEKERLKQYDASIKIAAPDASLQQFKASQICKYECGNRVSSGFRDDMIKNVQKDRMGI
eukprot:CAMPEP_0172480492 /NCGR_PEP_ID=MMETSP1066-20121228/5661_1 /TAXON_ID=671091 /ORGANISM="Coscinodiscus wailesii, Strain CCMP2513" /LENGTH=227 /DNA_ID=CAMNT_0013241851 /DNA_START=134 /DNA_END=817 /DNA_ORIENTATION=-